MPRKLFLIIVSALLLAACGPKKPNLPEVTTPTAPLVKKGFSFTPPNERGWYIMGQIPYRIALARQGNSQDETHAIQGMVFNINTFATDAEFVQAVKVGQASDTDIANPERFKVTTHDVTLRSHQGKPCAFSHIVTEDHAATKRSNATGHMVLEIYALVCRHPENRNAAINIDYSERYYPDQRSANIDAKAMTLIDSVKFEPLQ